MKRIIRLLSLFLALIILLSSTVFASSSNDGNVNAEADARVQQIDNLLSARQEIVFSEDPDLIALNDIDLQLHDLGVSFYTDEEAAEKFPEASAAMTQPTTGTVDMGAGDIAQPAYDIEGHGGGINLWTEYRVSNYYCEDEWVNIQKIHVQPLDEDRSVLWQEDRSTVRYTDEAWFAATTDIINVVVSTGLGTLWPPAATIYDICADAFSWILTSTSVEIDEISYRWECSTTVVFSYVRYEDETDDEQVLSVVSSQCEVDVVCTIDIDSYRQLGSGDVIPIPAQAAKNYHFITQSQHYNSDARAAFVFQRRSNTAYDYITAINIAAPGNKAFYIYPPTPQFPLQLV
jgi:hypothetical protein